MGKRTPEQCKEYRANHLEDILAADRRYNLKHRNGNPDFLEKARLRNKEYYARNKEDIDERRRMKRYLKKLNFNANFPTTILNWTSLRAVAF
jgi:hypothetical protein